jgi:hypothetical protein
MRFNCEVAAADQFSAALSTTLFSVRSFAYCRAAIESCRAAIESALFDERARSVAKSLAPKIFVIANCC